MPRPSIDRNDRDMYQVMQLPQSFMVPSGMFVVALPLLYCPLAWGILTANGSCG